MNEDKNVKIDEVSVSDAGAGASSDDAIVPAESGADRDEVIEQLNAQITELTDKYLRTAAELENTRRRAALDIESSARNRAMAIAKKILPVMDAIESAKKLNPDDDGIKSMALAMDSAFTQIGIVKIESLGQVMNPQFHNAVQVADAPSDANPKPKSNTVIEELQSGYMFGDTVLRPAMVVVAK